MTLTACYDLERNPPTYDVVTFLANLELERIARGEPDIDLHILPGHHGGFRRDDLWPHSVDERVHLRDNVVLPICRMLPSIRRVRLADDRSVGYVGGSASVAGCEDRWISLPFILKALRGGSRPLRADLEHAKLSAPLVTFTLREAEHHKERNSRADEWALAAEELSYQGLQIVIVRDTRMAHLPLIPADAEFSVAQAVNVPHVLEERARLYAAATLNVGISNGPMWMAVFMDAPVLMLRPTTNAAHGGYDDRYYTKCGLPPGSQLPTSPHHQRLVWEEDTRDNIVHAVEDMLGCL